MTRLDFDDLIDRLESRYAGRQAALERRTLAWVALGLLALLFWVIFLLFCGAALLVTGAVVSPPLNILLLLAGVALVVYGLCQAAYVLRVEPALRPGRVLRPDEAPALETFLAEIRRTLGCRSFEEIRLTINFNAAVCQVPRLGFFGWPRTHLEVGLPLALALSPEELRAVLVHECAHLSASHGRQAGRLYLLHQTWGNLIQKMQNPASGSLDRAGRWVLTTFLAWYWPRLHARALVLSRAHEYQADSRAAELVGTDNAMAALWRTECYEPWLNDKFWTELWQCTRDEPDPPDDVFSRLVEAGRAGPTPVEAARHVEQGLNRVAPRESTHPALIDRIRPLGRTAEDLRRLGFPSAPPVSAAEFFFAEHLADLMQEMSGQWRTSVLAVWRDRHRRARSEVLAQAKADAMAEIEAADIAVLWVAARDLANREGLELFAELLRQVLERNPGHAGAGALLGQHLASLGDPEGERLLSAVLAKGDEDWLPAAGAALEVYYSNLGMTDRVRDVRSILDRHEADVVAAQKERAAVTARDRFLPHGLADAPLEALQLLLKTCTELEAAWLVRKDLHYFPHRPLFVLCVRAGGTWWGGADCDAALVRRLASKVELPGKVLVIGRRGPFGALARKVAAQPDAEIIRSIR